MPFLTFGNINMKNKPEFDFSKDLKEINKLRSKLGLPLIKESDEQCLNCLQYFKSEGKHNRTCSVCRIENGFSE